MVVPDSAIGVAILLALVVPGVLYAAVRLWLRGFRWTDQNVSTRVFDAVLVSVVLDAVYLVVLGDDLVAFASAPRASFEREPRLVGGYLLGLGVLIPSAAAFVLHFRPRWWRPDWRWLARPQFRWIRLPVGRATAYESIPTAWDKVAQTMVDTWVKVQLPDGRRVGGWMSVKSFVSTYPQSRDIFVEVQFEVLADGTFGGRIEGSRGVWVSVPEGAVVEWLDAARPQQKEGSHVGSDHDH